MKKALLLAGFVIMLAGNAALSGQPLSPGLKVLPHDQHLTAVNGSHEDPLYLNYGSPAFNHPSYYYAAVASPATGIFYRQAGLSPDGTKIIAQKSFTEGSFNRTEIVLMDADGTDEIIISAGNSGEGDIYGYMNPFWSDDGNYIGFCEVHNTNANKVMRYQLSASTTEYIYEPVDNDVSNPDFLGTSITSIVFWAYGPAGGADFFTWDGTTLTNITNTANYKEYEPVSNPDGTKILFWSGETTAEPVNITHTLTYSGGVWTKDVGFTPIPDTYWSYWTDNSCTEIGTTVMSTKDIAIYDDEGTFMYDLTGPGYSGGSNQWNFFGSGIKGLNGEMLFTSNAGRAEAGRDIVMANPRAKLFVDDNGSDAYPGTVNAPFATIGKGISEALSGTTLTIESGTYNETINGDNKNNLSIIGNATNEPVINGSTHFSPCNDLTLKNLILKNTVSTPIAYIGGINLTMDNVTVDGEDITGHHGISGGHINGDVTVTNCSFLNIKNWVAFDTRSGSGGPTTGALLEDVIFTGNLIDDCQGHINFRGTIGFETDNVTITGNTVQNTGSSTNSFGAAIKVLYATNCIFSGNTIKDVGTSGYNPAGEAPYGAGFMPRNVASLTVTGNTFENNNQAIAIEPRNSVQGGYPDGVLPAGTIANNIFNNNTYGIYIPATLYPNSNPAGLSLENHNKFNNSGEALHFGYSAGMINAEENYWGTEVPDEVELEISGNADYDPWCNADLSVCGFTETSNIYNENQETYFLTVQDAINAASIGDVIEITGTHNVKNLVVNKGLKIAAAAGGAHFSGLDASRSGTGVVVTDDARITGITFSDYDIAVDIQSGAASIANCTFYNNVIAVKNLADNPVADADSCFWGDPTGPFDNSPAGLYNPLGVGDEVTDYVGYQPWYNDIDHTLLPVDIKITNPSCNTLNVYLKSNQAFAGNLTNIQFAVKWDATVYNGIVTPTFKYGSAGEGYIDLVKYENNGGSKYAVFVYYGGIASNWAEGGEVLILTLELDESGAMYNTTGFEIAQDAFVSGANENYYIQLDGDDRTGYIYGFAEDVYTATCDMPLDAKVFLQGPYDMYTDLMKTDLAGVIPTGAYPAGRQPFTGNPWLYNGTENLGSVPAGMVDWVLVELRTGTGAGTMAYRQAGLLFSDGTIRSAADPAKDIFFASDPTDLMPNSDFYIVVYHRNHMPVMSGAPVNIPNSAMLNLTDLTQAYGYVPASAVEQPLITLETGVYGMIAGDHYGAIPAGEGWNYFDYPDGWLYYSGNPNDRDPILAKIVSVTGLPYINGVINNVYFKEDLTMNKQVKYSGSGNDPRLIIQNLIELKGSNVLTNFYESKVPGWAIPHVKKEGLLSMTGPLDIGLYEAPRELLINITANETFTGAVVSNIQFTLCWDESNAEAGRLIAGYQGDFLLEPQGDPVKFAGKMYQVFATVEPVALPDPLNSGEQVTVLRFANSDAAPVAANGLAIADNAWTLANNGGYYIAVWGAGQTGRIVTEALGTDQPGDSGPVVRIYPNPTATGWIYLTTNPAVSGNLAVRLTDLTGRQLRQSQWSVKSGTANAMTFDLEGLSHGAYLLNINGESFSFSERIIIR